MIFGSATIFGIISYFVIPEDKWLSREKILLALQTADTPTENHE